MTALPRPADRALSAAPASSPAVPADLHRRPGERRNVHVTAHYAGDANHEGSDGSAVPIIINKASTTTTTRAGTGRL